MGRKRSVSVKRYNGKIFFSRNLGKALYDTAVYNAPKDTGNLRQSIRLVASSNRLIRIRYSSYHAHYVGILEQGKGKGRGKQHKHFISKKTRYAMIKDILSYYSSQGQGNRFELDEEIMKFRDMSYGELFTGASPRDIRNRHSSFNQRTRTRRRSSHAIYRSMLND